MSSLISPEQLESWGLGHLVASRYWMMNDKAGASFEAIADAIEADLDV